MNQVDAVFRKPNSFERILNKAFGAMVGLGLGLRHNYPLQVPGRKSGRIYSTPIDLLELKEKRFLVAPRGHTEWARNAEAAGEIVLKKGIKRQIFRIRTVSHEEKPEILKAYLDRFKLTVQRYFPLRAGSAPSAFPEIAEGYPAFELLPINRNQDRQE